MRILVTGAAGFIGFHLVRRLLDRGGTVVGLDNLNNYYDVRLKRDRLMQLEQKKNFSFIEANLEDSNSIQNVFDQHAFDRVVNLAAQAGVRYSLENPRAYIDANILGFLNILENCRHNEVPHLVYASSSSVYGANTKMPFSVQYTSTFATPLIGQIYIQLDGRQKIKKLFYPAFEVKVQHSSLLTPH